MENMAARQTFRVGGGGHLFAANDAHVVGVGEFFCGCVGVVGVHDVDGLSREYDVVEGLLEGSHRQVHGTDGEEGQGVDADHDRDEDDVQDHLETIDNQT